VIDLHLHTTASDGVHDPAALVARAKEVGLTIIGVADHDTMAAVPDLERETRAAGIGFVPGIEITAAWQGHDIHVLGYFLDHRSPMLMAFLSSQRDDRVRRARLVAERLAALGVPIDVEPIIAGSMGRPVSRPDLARALVDAGHTLSVRDAFDRFLGDDKPAFVPRSGVSPTGAVRTILDAGGIASLAHPGITRQDTLIPELAAAGLGALEVYHPDHTAADAARYLAMARQLHLGVTGGSDYHGEGSHHASGFGTVGLPASDFAEVCRRAGRSVA
jgi:predicted metal-dependent phosphoesterase TrpH